MGSTGSINVQFETMNFNTPVMTNQGSISFDQSFMSVDGNFDNTGQVSFSGESSLLVTGDFQNNGDLIMFSSDATVQGTYSGDGDFTGDGLLSIEGMLAVGNSTASVLMDGVLDLGTNSIWDVELGGVNSGEFDQIVGMDQFNIDGNLSVALVNGFTLDDGMEFLIADVEGGAFGQFVGLSEGALVGNFGGSDLYISYAAGYGNDVALYTSAVPEPNSAVLCGLVGLACLFRRRRRDSRKRTSRHQTPDQLAKRSR